MTEKVSLIDYQSALQISDMIYAEEAEKFRSLKPENNNHSILEKLCVVIPNYNNLNRIKKVVESIQKEIDNSISIQIIDNHSTDGSWECIQELTMINPSISALRMPFNTGPHYTTQILLKSNLFPFTLFS